MMAAYSTRGTKKRSPKRQEVEARRCVRWAASLPGVQEVVGELHMAKINSTAYLHSTKILTTNIKENLPSSSSNKELADSIANFFVEKIQ